MSVEKPFDPLYTGLREYASTGLNNCFDANTFRLFKSFKHSDAIIHCGGQKFKVHKIVLYAQSKYFSKIFDGDWKVCLSTSLFLVRE